MVLSEESLAAWVRARSAGAHRYLLGVVGPPGSGKSTLAAQLGAQLQAPVVAMDGFHRLNADLEAAGLRAIKGAPETFAAHPFVDLVRSLRDRAGDVWCPVFDRSLDEPIVDRVCVGADDHVVIVEGNYLLLDTAPWCELRALFDDVAYLDVPEEVRTARLIDRHVEFGSKRSEAAAFVARSDAANAQVVEAGRARASAHVAMAAQ